MPDAQPEQARPVWIDEDWFDRLIEALIRTGRPGLAEKFREKWWAAPPDATEAVVSAIYSVPGWYEAPMIAPAVLRALGMPHD